MSNKELGKVLLQLDTAPGAAALDSHQLTRSIAGRDRRRIRVLTSLASLFWVLSSAGLIWLVALYLLYVEPRLRAYAAGRAELQTDWNDWARAGNLAAVSILACLISLFLAAACTMLLIMFSRHATLRQINASLREISEQLGPHRRGSIADQYP